MSFWFVCFAALFVAGCSPLRGGEGASWWDPPIYSEALADEFVYRQLLTESNPAVWRATAATLVRRYGAVYGPVVRRELESIAGSRSDRAKAVLAAVDAELPAGPDGAVRMSELAGRIEAERGAVGEAEAAALWRVFRSISGRDYDVYDPLDRAMLEDVDALAVACMRKLIGRGHDGEIRRFCAVREAMSLSQGPAMREILARLKTAD